MENLNYESKINESIKYLQITPIQVKVVNNGVIVDISSIDYNRTEFSDFIKMFKAVKLFINAVEVTDDYVRMLISDTIRPRWAGCTEEELEEHLKEYLNYQQKLKGRQEDFMKARKDSVDICIESIQKDMKID